MKKLPELPRVSFGSRRSVHRPEPIARPGARTPRTTRLNTRAGSACQRRLARSGRTNSNSEFDNRTCNVPGRVPDQIMRLAVINSIRFQHFAQAQPLLIACRRCTGAREWATALSARAIPVRGPTVVLRHAQQLSTPAPPRVPGRTRARAPIIAAHLRSVFHRDQADSAIAPPFD